MQLLVLEASIHSSLEPKEDEKMLRKEAEDLMVEFTRELGDLIQKYVGPLNNKFGLASAYLMVGILEQGKQKILREFYEYLESSDPEGMLG